MGNRGGKVKYLIAILCLLCLGGCGQQELDTVNTYNNNGIWAGRKGGWYGLKYTYLEKEDGNKLYITEKIEFDEDIFMDVKYFNIKDEKFLLENATIIDIFIEPKLIEDREYKKFIIKKGGYLENKEENIMELWQWFIEGWINTSFL